MSIERGETDSNQFLSTTTDGCPESNFHTQDEFYAIIFPNKTANLSSLHKSAKNVLVTQRIVGSGPETMKDVLQYVYSLLHDQKVIGEWLTLDLHQ